MRTFTLLAAFALSCCPVASIAADDPFRVLPEGERSKDVRLGPPKTLNGYFPMTVPKSKAEWESRRTALREQVLVSQGLWPMPEKTPLKPIIHGKIDRDEYTIEKVYFASLPGHYVTGNLYRPKKEGKNLPGILCPHGHWRNGRFYDAGEEAAMKEIKSGAEKTIASARYPLQARCAMLARMGCVVFFYDMVGNADSTVIGHATGFADADGELNLQSAMALQTWNSIRALDFITSLPEVDAKRIGVTGASGGGTQTFMLGAIDDRPAVAFPAVMVSTAMQGGCVCENCSYLRVDAGNIDLAALFAPRPMAMSGANDWTIDIERKGLPELQAVYKLYGVEDHVSAKCWPQFGHNYNQVAREMMYDWMNRHLKLGHKSPIAEKPFEPVPPRELSVFDAQHPVPKDAVDVKKLRQAMKDRSDRQINALLPKDEASLKEYRRVFGTFLRTAAGGSLPAGTEVESKEIGEREVKDGIIVRRFLIGRKGSGEQVPALGMTTEKFNGTVVVWIDPKGVAGLGAGGKPTAEVKKLLDGGAGLLVVDVLGVGQCKGDKPMPIDARFAGYTYGYNRSLLANRVRDVLTAVAFAKSHPKAKQVHLVGVGAMGPCVLLASGLCGDDVARTAADANAFRFDSVRTTSDEMMMPGALKYGGLPALSALAAPGELFVHGHRGTGMGGWLKPVYDAAKAKDRVKTSGETASLGDVVDWVLR